MKTRFALAVCAALLPVSLVSTALAADSNASTELHIRGLDALWSKTAGTKDLDKTVSFYADDATVCPPNAAAATTKDAVRKVWKDLLDTPGLTIGWKTAKVELAKSEDLACASGTYEVTMNDAGGKPVKEHGKYVEVWKKEADGKWKCVVDIWNSDLPVPALAEKK
jgi:ketosteroid isomerase-like protein